MAGKVDTEGWRSTLVQTGWLSRCPADCQVALLARAQWKTWQRDQLLWLAGEVGGGLIGIADGVVGLMTGLAEPGVPMGDVFRAGSWTGDNTVLTGQPRLLTMVARTRVHGAVIAANQVEALLAQRPEWWRWIGLLSSTNGLTATLLATDLMRSSGRARVAAVLLHSSGARLVQHDGPIATPGITQDDIGSMCGLNRTSVRRILSDFEDRQWISYGYRWFCVHAPEALEAILSVDSA